MPHFPFPVPPCQSTLRGAMPLVFSSCRLHSANSSNVNNDLNPDANLVLRYLLSGPEPFRWLCRSEKKGRGPQSGHDFVLSGPFAGVGKIPAGLTSSQHQRTEIRRLTADIGAVRDGR